MFLRAFRFICRQRSNLELRHELLAGRQHFDVPLRLLREIALRLARPGFHQGDGVLIGRARDPAGGRQYRFTPPLATADTSGDTARRGDTAPTPPA